jgi:peptide/nickel transport system permease protein
VKTIRELLKDRKFSVGVSVLLVFAMLAVLSFFSPYDPLEWHVVPRDRPPSWEHPLGTNSLGQDVFWQMSFAIRNSLVLAVFAAVISRIIAVAIGLIAGYRGGITDRVLMLLGDASLVIPLFLILVLLALLLRDYMNLVTLGLILGVVGWGWDARLIRSQILSLREREFTHTAILCGTPTHRLILNEYIPFIIPLVLATFINHMAFVVGMEITLAFVGLTDLTIPTLGTMLHWAISYQAILLGLFWWLFTPVGAAVAFFAGMYLLSVSISNYLDPRARMQRVGVG